jgi:hypothetical protein
VNNVVERAVNKEGCELYFFVTLNIVVYVYYTVHLYFRKIDFLKGLLFTIYTMSSTSYLIIRANGRVSSDNNLELYQAIVNTKTMTHEWDLQNDAKKYKLRVFGEERGKYNKVNKYEFPPPIDTILFYGDVFILCLRKNKQTYEPVDLSIDSWKMFCRHTFQFESLQDTESSDKYETDELKLIPSHKKTKHGYLKDGFVVDDDDDE